MFSALNILWQNLLPKSKLIHLHQLNLIFFPVSEHLYDKVRETKIKASVKSDHKISTIAIHVTQVPRGPDFLET